MASSDAVLSRPGQSNLAGDTEALFLKLFGGEVLTEFETATVFKDKHFSRQIKNGKSAQFPLIGKATVRTHTPGTYIVEDQIPSAEKVITIDAKIIASTSIADIEEAKNHYDVRGPYSTEIGRALAYHYDKNVARSMLAGARASNPLTGRSGGSVLTNANYATDAAALEAALFLSAQTLDEKNIQSDGRSMFLRPAQFYLLAQRDRLVNTQLGANGSVATGKVGTVANIDIVMSNQVPNSNDTAVTTIPTGLRQNFATTVGIVSTPMAAASVQLMSLAMEMEREIRTQSFFMVASYAVGHDWLRPECAIELKTA